MIKRYENKILQIICTYLRNLIKNIQGKDHNCIDYSAKFHHHQLFCFLNSCYMNMSYCNIMFLLSIFVKNIIYIKLNNFKKMVTLCAYSALSALKICTLFAIISSSCTAHLAFLLLWIIYEL